MDVQAILFLSEREKLYQIFKSKLEVTTELNRRLISFQANKVEPIYRWFKYREGYSSGLVKYFITKYGIKSGKILDPFGGIGTTLFAAKELLWSSYGIELLPVGNFVMKAREAISRVHLYELNEILLTFWKEIQKLRTYNIHINHIPITEHAFPKETEVLLNKYLTYCDRILNEDLKTVLKFVALCVLEDISYTRKDGQYLRWDFRSKRTLSGKPFNKGVIKPFKEAIKEKLSQILNDLRIERSNLIPFDEYPPEHPISLFQGSCLDHLPTLHNNQFDFIMTSPPYCNRYDYTRTYALELVFLGFNATEVKDLRQSMLSCTVENKEKLTFIKSIYEKLNEVDHYERVMDIYHDSKPMREVNTILTELNAQEKLNNANVPRMVKNYFLEMCFTISEMYRILVKDGFCVMVNDNVRYGGEEIPVDLILSDFAQKLGFYIEKIFVLPRGKGNSSQQMGNYGRTETRKCVYLWRKQ